MTIQNFLKQSKRYLEQTQDGCIESESEINNYKANSTWNTMSDSGKMRICGSITRANSSSK